MFTFFNFISKIIDGPAVYAVPLAYRPGVGRECLRLGDQGWGGSVFGLGAVVGPV